MSGWLGGGGEGVWVFSSALGVSRVCFGFLVGRFRIPLVFPVLSRLGRAFGLRCCSFVLDLLLSSLFVCLAHLVVFVLFARFGV